MNNHPLRQHHSCDLKKVREGEFQVVHARTEVLDRTGLIQRFRNAVAEQQGLKNDRRRIDERDAQLQAEINQMKALLDQEGVDTSAI